MKGGVGCTIEVDIVEASERAKIIVGCVRGGGLVVCTVSGGSIETETTKAEELPAM